MLSLLGATSSCSEIFPSARAGSTKLPFIDTPNYTTFSSTTPFLILSNHVGRLLSYFPVFLLYQQISADGVYLCFCFYSQGRENWNMVLWYLGIIGIIGIEDPRCCLCFFKVLLAVGLRSVPRRTWERTIRLICGMILTGWRWIDNTLYTFANIIRAKCTHTPSRLYLIFCTICHFSDQLINYLIIYLWSGWNRYIHTWKLEAAKEQPPASHGDENDYRRPATLINKALLTFTPFLWLRSGLSDRPG